MASPSFGGVGAARLLISHIKELVSVTYVMRPVSPWCGGGVMS